MSSAIVPCQISLSGPSVAVETIANPPPIFSSSSRLSRRLVLPSPSVPLIARVGARRTIAYCSGGYGSVSSGPREAVNSRRVSSPSPPQHPCFVPHAPSTRRGVAASRSFRRLVLPSPSVPLIARAGALCAFMYCSGGFGSVSSGPREAIMSCC